MPAQPASEIAAFRQEMESIMGDISATFLQLSTSMDKVKAMETALSRSSGDITQLSADLFAAKSDLNKLDLMLNGNKAKGEIGARTPPTVQGRMFVGFRGLRTTYGPTVTHKKSVADAKTELKGIKSELLNIVNSVLPKLESSLKTVGAPMIEGQMSGNKN